MVLDFTEANDRVKQFATNLYQFKTLKPLVFIIKGATWCVFSLHDNCYRANLLAYYMHTYGTYQEARKAYKQEMEYFQERPSRYGRWPIK